MSDNIILDYPSSFIARNSFLPTWKQWKHVKESVLAEGAISRKAVRLWEEWGKPEGRDKEIWFRARDALMLEYLRTQGITGNPQENEEPARFLAITQYVRRRRYAANFKKKENDPNAASLYFYCKDCGVFLEELPRDFLYAARTACSQCTGLRSSGWLVDATKAFETGSIPDKKLEVQIF